MAGLTTNTYTPDNWVTGSEPVANATVTLAAGIVAGARTPIEVDAAGVGKVWVPATGKAVYLLSLDADTSGGAKAVSEIKAGSFNPDLVQWPAATAAQKLGAFVGTPISLQKPY